MSSRSPVIFKMHFIDPTRILRSVDMDSELSIRQIKKIIEPDIDNYDSSKFTIEFGELSIKEEMTLRFLEEQRKKYELIGYNYRVELLECSNVIVPFMFDFGHSDKRTIKFALNMKVSIIKEFLSKNGYPKCEELDSIALFFNSENELDDNIMIRRVGIPKNEPIEVRKIDCQYKVIMPGGSSNLFTMKKRSTVLHLKKLVVENNPQWQLYDFTLKLNKGDQIVELQNDTILFYERITENQIITVNLKKNETKAIFDEPKIKKRTKKNKSFSQMPQALIEPNRRSSTNMSQKKDNLLQLEELRKLRNCEYPIANISAFDEENGDSAVSIYVNFEYQTDKFSLILPEKCTALNAKTELIKYFLRKIGVNLTEKNIVIRKKGKRLKEQQTLKSEQGAQLVPYVVDLDFKIYYNIRGEVISKDFKHYPNLEEAELKIKDDLTMRNPKYSKFRLTCDGKVLGSQNDFKVVPDQVIDVEIIDLIENKQKMYFQIPKHDVIEYELDIETTVDRVCAHIAKDKDHQAQLLKLIFNGKILDNRLMMKDYKIDKNNEKNPIMIYVKQPINSRMERADKRNRHTKQAA